MHKGQEQFFQFMMDCVQQGHEDLAKKMLTDCFDRQEKGSFSKEELEQFNTEIVKLLKPERKEEVVSILNQFGSMHVNH